MEIVNISAFRMKVEKLYAGRLYNDWSATIFSYKFSRSEDALFHTSLHIFDSSRR